MHDALAHAKATEGGAGKSSPSAGSFGAIGYRFSKNFADESGNSLGWFEGVVIGVVAGSGE